MKDLECSSCGASIGLKEKFSKFFVCEYCGSAIFIEDDAIKNAGKMSKVIDVPSLINLGYTYTYRNFSFTPIGMVSYDYGRGFWDEFYVSDNEGKYHWVSVDEGDIAIEEPVKEQLNISQFNSIKIGDTLSLYKNEIEIPLLVTEKNSCRCIGAKGELPFPVTMEEKYNYLDLSGPGGTIYTIEYTEDGTDVYYGKWIDPYDIKKI